MPAPFNHSSGLAGVYDRTPDKPNVARVLFREEKLAQAAEHMEAQSISEARNRRVGDLIAKDGDRVTGAEILVDPQTGTVVLGAGTIYVQGDVRPVAAQTLNGVPMTGTVPVGVRLIRTVVTEVQDPTLVGLAPGTEAEGEPGAGREIETVVWGRDGDGASGGS
jgi:tRNA U54 and U55 pseudouridine synthase Pus10